METGGSTHSGGEFEGGGMIGMAGNLMDKCRARNLRQKQDTMKDRKRLV